MKKYPWKQAVLAAAVAQVLTACGGGGTGGAGSASGVTTVGTVTGFGSVYVNGVEYETGSSRYEVDDQEAFDDSALQVGMVVKLSGSRSGSHGDAAEIIYDEDIEGPVAGLTTDATNPDLKHFQIYGLDVTVSASGTRFDNRNDPAFSFSTITDGDDVEISGQFDGQRVLASYIKKEDATDNDDELKGVVDSLSGDTFTLLLMNGAAVTITIDPGASLPAGGLQNGQYVEVEGTPTGPAALTATRVELEDRHYLDDDEGEIEISGLLAHDAPSDSWSLNGIPLNLDGDIEYEPASLRDAIDDLSAAGMTVKVEGDYQNGVLQVDEMKNGQDDLEVKGRLVNITASGAKQGVLEVGFGGASGTVRIIVDGSTLFADDSSQQHFDLRTVAVDSFVEIKARQDQSGDLIATRLHVEDSPGEFEVEGPVDDFQDGSTITVLGVTFTVDGGTAYPLGKPVVGNQVDVTDTDGDGRAEQVELDD